MAIIVEKRAVKLGYKEDKPTVYKMAAVRQQKVTYDKVLTEVSNSCGVNRSQSKAVIEALIDRMTMFMDFGMGVQLGEFGTFQPAINSKVKGTEDEVSSDDVKRVKIRFYPGKRFKSMLAQMSVASFSDDGDEEVTDETPSGGTSGEDDEGQDFT